jgi:transposase
MFQSFRRLREIIVCDLELEASIVFGGEIEVDISYFGGNRKRKRGHRMGGKDPVCGLLKHKGTAYTKIILDARSTALVPITEEKIVPGSIVCSDCWQGYNVLDVSDFKRRRVNHSNLFIDFKWSGKNNVF